MIRWLRELFGDFDGGDSKLAIVPPVVKFSGFDPDLRDRTAARRVREADIRKAANRIASAPDRKSASRLRMIGERT